MISENRPLAYGEFASREAASSAVDELESEGIDPQRIWLDAHAPEQSGTPVHQAGADNRTMRRFIRIGAQGMALGAIVGAIVGALGGYVLIGSVWAALGAGAGLAAFGLGVGFLVTSLGRVKEGAHGGTVTDEPDANQPVRLAVRCRDATEQERVGGLLAELGADVGEPPEPIDFPDR